MKNTFYAHGEYISTFYSYGAVEPALIFSYFIHPAVVPPESALVGINCKTQRKYPIKISITSKVLSRSGLLQQQHNSPVND